MMKAKYLMFLIEPSRSQHPFTCRLAFQHKELDAEGIITIKDCVSITEAVKQADRILEELQLEKEENYTLVYPMFGFGSDDKSISQKALYIAKEIQDEARIYHCLFSRTIF